MTRPPDLSIIVPVYRHWHRLTDLLSALQALESPECNVEVIIVDNDPERHGPRPTLFAGARYVSCPDPGSYSARNAGAAQARGTLLAFTDADCQPDPDWAVSLCAAAMAHPGALLAGLVQMPLPPRPNRWQIFDAVRGIPQDLFVAHGYAASANLAVPATLFNTLGGFDTTRLSGGDAEFCRRAGQAGHRLVLVRNAIVRHPARASLAQLATKARRIKGGQVAAGPVWRRVFWTLRSLAPPFRECLHYLRNRAYPLRWRLTAMGVRFRLWGIELVEVARLLAGGQSERR